MSVYLGCILIVAIFKSILYLIQLVTNIFIDFITLISLLAE